MSKKITVSDFRQKKETDEKITMLTAYDYSTAKLFDQAGIDGLLVGDSLGMVMLGYDNTLQVKVDDIIHHSKAVARGADSSLVVADMPFLSYHINTDETVKNAGRLIQEGNAEAVKLEGGEDIMDKIEAIIKAQIPVVGHLGLTPQSVNVAGGFKVQGKSKQDAENLLKDAKILEQLGVFAVVLECVPEPLARLVSQELSIPTIGIGAGSSCDGQILVYQDMLGMYSDMVPKFVKKYTNLGDKIKEAVEEYIEEVKSEKFPAEEHCFSMDESILKDLK